MNSLLYIHGFASSSSGFKGQAIKKLMKSIGREYALDAPDLCVEPLAAISQLESIIKHRGQPVLIGSSLGGYYATYLAQQYDLKALLVNPVVLPHKFLGRAYVDESDFSRSDLWSIDFVRRVLKERYQSDEVFIQNYIEALAILEVLPPKDKERFIVWLKTGDEVLDYHYAANWYKECTVQVDEGDDHSFSDFEMRLPEILAWAGINPV